MIFLTLNSEKSTLISLLEGWCVDDVDDELLNVELDARDDIDDSPPSSDFLQMSSNFAAFDVLVVGGNTIKKENFYVNWLIDRKS